MRTIAGFTVLVIILCIVPALSAQEKLSDNYAFSLFPRFGVFYGQAEEIVYPDADHIAELLSQLLWDMKPVFYFGLALDFSRRNPLEKWGLFSNLSLKFGIPRLSGYMEDRDWLSIENPDLTHYSVHDNMTKELFFLEFSAGYSYPLYPVLLLQTFIDMSFMRFCFYGTDGYTKYARKISEGKYHSINDNPDVNAVYGKAINYTQEWLIISPGVSLNWYFYQNFCAALSFKISPLIFCADLDEHLKTNTQYRDYMQYGLYLEPEARFSYSINEWMDISLDFSWRYIRGSSGATYSTNYGAGFYKPGGKAGAGLSLLDASLLLKTRL